MFAGASGAGAEELSDVAAALASVAGAAEFASPTGAAAFAFASPAFVFASAGVLGALCNTDRLLPVNIGIEINNAVNMKTAAAAIVSFESTVAVPLGPKAALDTLLVNRAPASVFPG